MVLSSFFFHRVMQAKLQPHKIPLKPYSRTFSIVYSIKTRPENPALPAVKQPVQPPLVAAMCKQNWSECPRSRWRKKRNLEMSKANEIISDHPNLKSHVSFPVKNNLIEWEKKNHWNYSIANLLTNLVNYYYYQHQHHLQHFIWITSLFNVKSTEEKINQGGAFLRISAIKRVKVSNLSLFFIGVFRQTFFILMTLKRYCGSSIGSCSLFLHVVQSTDRLVSVGRCKRHWNVLWDRCDLAREFDGPKLFVIFL